MHPPGDAIAERETMAAHLAPAGHSSMTMIWVRAASARRLRGVDYSGHLRDAGVPRRYDLKRMAA
jgi:hypothetical protein